MGPKEYLSLFVSEGLKLKPDMLLLSFFVGNDFIDCLNSERKWHSYSYATSFLYYLITIWHNYEGIVVHGRGDYCDDCPTFDKNTYLQVQGERSFIFIEGNELFIKSLDSVIYYLSSINDICKKEHIEFIVVLIPDELQMDRILQNEVIDNYYPASKPHPRPIKAPSAAPAALGSRCRARAGEARGRSEPRPARRVGGGDAAQIKSTRLTPGSSKTSCSIWRSG